MMLTTSLRYGVREGCVKEGERQGGKEDSLGMGWAEGGVCEGGREAASLRYMCVAGGESWSRW